MTHACGTCVGIFQLLSVLQPLTEEEKQILLERSRKSAEEVRAVMAQREKDRLLKMKSLTDFIQ